MFGALAKPASSSRTKSRSIRAFSTASLAAAQLSGDSASDSARKVPAASMNVPEFQ